MMFELVLALSSSASSLVTLLFQRFLSHSDIVELCLKPSILVLKSHTSLLLPRFRSAVDQLNP